jgi:hypothetical protein
MIELRHLVTETDYLLQYRQTVEVSTNYESGLAEIPPGAIPDDQGRYWTDWETVPEVNG